MGFSNTKNTKNTSTYIVIGIMLLLVTIFVIFAMMGRLGGDTVIKELSTIYTKIQTTSNSLPVSIDVSIELNSDIYYDRTSIEKSIKNSLSKVSHDDITGKNSFRIVNNLIYEVLEDSFPKLDVKQVYVTDLSVGGMVEYNIEKKDTSKSQRRSSFFKGLFKNVK